MNFCPSWAPCIKLMAAAPKIWAPWKKRFGPAPVHPRAEDGQQLADDPADGKAQNEGS